MYDAGAARIRSNARLVRLPRLIAVGNSGDAALAPRTVALLAHPSPLVRAMAVWAGRRLLGTDGLRAASPGSRAAETDAGVLAEWEHP